MLPVFAIDQHSTVDADKAAILKDSVYMALHLQLGVLVGGLCLMVVCVATGMFLCVFTLRTPPPPAEEESLATEATPINARPYAYADIHGDE